MVGADVVGLSLGLEVMGAGVTGASVGKGVGFGVGDWLGLDEGAFDGALLGVDDGDLLGDVGSLDGDLVG